MINKNEVRIGNWFEYPMFGYQKITSTEEIDSMDESAALEIFLTEEILKKSGFRIKDKTDFGIWFQFKGKENIEISKLGNEYKKNWNVKLMTYTMTHIQFLHQLQNFYFGITGHDLNIEL